MSTHQDSVEVSTDIEGGAVQEGNNGSDSLTLFLVAIGSAVLSTLFTLLILAVVNDGTLSFTGGDRLAQFQGYMEQVNGNVGTLNDRVEAVNGRAEELNADLGELQAELANQNMTMDGLDEAIMKVDQTRQQFDGFVSALGVALSSIRSEEGGDVATEAATEAATEENTEPVIVKTKSETGEGVSASSESEEATLDEAEAETTASDEEESADSLLPMIEISDQLPADAIAALILEDTNGNGVLDGGETSISGATISLIHHGDVVESKTTDDAGVTFMALAPGSYELTVDDAAGYALSNAATIQVDVADENEEGQFVYFTIQPGE